MSSIGYSVCKSSSLSFIVNEIPETHERRKIHAWLAPLDQDIFVTETSDLEEPGTCDWLSKEDKRIGDFLRRNNPSLVWLYGEGLF